MPGEGDGPPAPVVPLIGSAPETAAMHTAPARPGEPGESGESGVGDVPLVRDDGGDASATDGRWVSVRDVWRAARARRRALRAEMRRFTARQRRRRAVWIATGVALAALVAGSFGAAYSPLFAVERITVTGTHRLDATALEKALDAQRGTPLPLVDEGKVKAALVAFPLVETYALEARPPHELVVRIVERTPVGVVKGPAGYTLVDAAGVALSTTATAPKGQPVLTVARGVDSDAFRSAGQVVRSLPGSIRSQVTAVTASTPDDVTLTLGKTHTKVVWGGAEDSAMKALVLQKLMKSRPPSKVSSYDVSSPGAAVVR